MVSHHFFTIFYRFVQLYFLPEFFGKKKSEKRVKSIKTNRMKTNNKYTVIVFGPSHRYSRDPLEI